MRCSAVALALVMSCSKSDETPAVAKAGSGSAVQPARPGAGFSADLAKEFEGSGSAAPKTEAGSASAKTGSATGSGAGRSEPTISAGGEKGSAPEKPAEKAPDKAAEKAPEKPAEKAPDKAAEKAPDKAAEKAPEKPAEKAPDKALAKPNEKPAAPDKAGTKTEAAKPPPDGLIVQGGPPVKRIAAVPAELAAIKLALKPNWERDVQEAGTFSLAVKIPGSDKSAVFVFHYGYEDASAPADRDAYKKWLADRKVLTALQDRQAGSAWILEGTDQRGARVFRTVVNWSNKKLICYGSLYRDAEASKLGDLRDDTIVQAKQICESVAL